MKLERTRCPECGAKVSGRVPRLGDGTALRLVSHKRERSGSGILVRERCPGSGEVVFLTVLDP